MTLEELKKLAEAATPGNWKFFVLTKDKRVGNYLNLVAAVAPGHQIRSDNEGGSYPSADGEYIAAMSPATLQKLLEMIAVLKNGTGMENAPCSCSDCRRARANEIEQTL